MDTVVLISNGHTPTLDFDIFKMNMNIRFEVSPFRYMESQ